MPTDLFGETILVADYEGVQFHVTSESTELGNDLVVHTAYLRPGAELEPTGWKPEKGVLDCLFFNDIEPGLWPDRMKELLAAIRRKPIGSFVHPVSGLMTAALHTIHRETKSEERDGCRLRIEFIEHNASASSLLGFSNATRVDTPETAVRQAAAADAAMAEAAPNGGYTSTLAVIAAELDKLETQVRAVSEIESSLRAMANVVTEQIQLPLFAGSDGYQAVVALEALRASVVNLRSRYLPDASLIRQYVVPVTMPVWSVSKQVYGDASKADLIMSANSLPDPLFIAAGSVLQILPIQSKP